MEKKYATVIAVLGVLAIVFAGTTGYFGMNYTKSQAEYQALSDDYQTLSDDYDALSGELNQTQIWLDGNKTLLQETIAERDQLQTWLDGNKTLLQETMTERDQLEEWLESNITSYETQIQGLNTEIDSLNGQITNLQNQISELQKVDLDGYAEISGTIYITVEGYVWNYGTETAYDVSVTICLTYQGTLVYSAVKYIGDVQGRNVVPFEVSFTYTGLWDDWYWYIT